MEEDGSETIAMCERCADHISRNGLRVDEDLMDHRIINVCRKIADLEGPKLKSLILKFIASEKIEKEKLSAVVELCEGNTSDFCNAFREASAAAAPEEELISVDDIRECAEEVSRDYDQIKFKVPKDTWFSARDFEWKDEDVASNVTMYTSLHK